MKTIACIPVMTAAVLLAASGARADSAAEGASVRIRYSDLDLNRTTGSATLYKRVSSAAELVCKDLDISSEPLHSHLKAAYAGCVQHAIAGAIARINRPEFTTYAQTRLPLATSQLASLRRK
jgi:UrcA family protein